MSQVWVKNEGSSLKLREEFPFRWFRYLSLGPAYPDKMSQEYYFLNSDPPHRQPPPKVWIIPAKSFSVKN